jgi:hypothetical protein
MIRRDWTQVLGYTRWIPHDGREYRAERRGNDAVVIYTRTPGKNWSPAEIAHGRWTGDDIESEITTIPNEVFTRLADELTERPRAGRPAVPPGPDVVAFRKALAEDPELVNIIARLARDAGDERVLNALGLTETQE